MKRSRLARPGRGARFLLVTVALLLLGTAWGPDEQSGATGDGGTERGATPTAGGTLEVILGKSPDRGLDRRSSTPQPSGEANYVPAIFGTLIWIQSDTGEAWGSSNASRQ